MPKALETYSEFWPFYLAEHRRPLTRHAHVFGTGLAFAIFGVALATQTWWLIAVAFLCGYLFAWVSHMVVERNRPATFTYPWWSFISDLRMFWLACTGRLGAEIRRYQGAGE